MAFPCWVDGLTRKAARLSARPDNPAGRKPHLQGSVACGITTQALCALPESQRPEDRATDDKARNNAHEKDHQFHDASFEKRGGTTAPCGSVTAPAGLKKSFQANERPDMRGVAPSLFGKPLLGKGLSPHPLIADVSALLPTPILQHPGRLGNGADGIRTRSRQGDNLLLCQLSYRPNGTNWYPLCAFVRRTDTVRWRPSKPPAV